MRKGDELGEQGRRRALLNKGVTLAAHIGGEEAMSVYDDELLMRFRDDAEVEVRAAVAQGLMNKGMTLRRFHRLDGALAVYRDLISRFGADDDPTVQKLVLEAPTARTKIKRRPRWLTTW